MDTTSEQCAERGGSKAARAAHLSAEQVVVAVVEVCPARGQPVGARQHQVCGHRAVIVQRVVEEDQGVRPGPGHSQVQPQGPVVFVQVSHGPAVQLLGTTATMMGITGLMTQKRTAL